MAHFKLFYTNELRLLNRSRMDPFLNHRCASRKRNEFADLRLSEPLRASTYPPPNSSTNWIAGPSVDRILKRLETDRSLHEAIFSTI